MEGARWVTGGAENECTPGAGAGRVPFHPRQGKNMEFIRSALV